MVVVFFDPGTHTIMRRPLMYLVMGMFLCVNMSAAEAPDAKNRLNKALLNMIGYDPEEFERQQQEKEKAQEEGSQTGVFHFGEAPPATAEREIVTPDNTWQAFDQISRYMYQVNGQVEEFVDRLANNTREMSTRAFSFYSTVLGNRTLVFDLSNLGPSWSTFSGAMGRVWGWAVDEKTSEFVNAAYDMYTQQKQERDDKKKEEKEKKKQKNKHETEL